MGLLQLLRVYSAVLFTYRYQDLLCQMIRRLSCLEWNTSTERQFGSELVSLLSHIWSCVTFRGKRGIFAYAMWESKIEIYNGKILCKIFGGTCSPCAFRCCSSTWDATWKESADILGGDNTWFWSFTSELPASSEKGLAEGKTKISRCFKGRLSKQVSLPNCYLITFQVIDAISSYIQWKNSDIWFLLLEYIFTISRLCI